MNMNETVRLEINYNRVYICTMFAHHLMYQTPEDQRPKNKTKQKINCFGPILKDIPYFGKGVYGRQHFCQTVSCFKYVCPPPSTPTQTLECPALLFFCYIFLSGISVNAKE